MAATIIKTGDGYESSKYREIMVESEADLETIDLSDVAVGSVAYRCAEGQPALDQLWMLSGEKVWVAM